MGDRYRGPLSGSVMWDRYEDRYEDRYGERYGPLNGPLNSRLLSLLQFDLSRAGLGPLPRTVNAILKVFLERAHLKNSP